MNHVIARFSGKPDAAEQMADLAKTALQENGMTARAAIEAVVRVSENSRPTINDQLHERYEPVAAYYVESDCVEYVKSDSIAIYDRIDEFLTLIFDETQSNLIGFKLKGFKHIFEQRLKHISKLRNIQFVDLVSAIETMFTEVGDKIMAAHDERREKAYKEAWELASNDNVRLSSEFLRELEDA